MKLSDEQVEEFRALCEVTLKLGLSVDEARAEATNLMQLYELLARPLPSEIAAHEGETQSPPALRYSL